ncbi:MAG: T9SS type A sorting domain-containing protein [Bacteroidia bacterium]|nr:T9SS type A sorting domain-containing protein [Bacteroidia bacterium]
MKRIYLIVLSILTAFGANAQIINPMNASTIVELKEVEWTFPGFKDVTSKIKYLVSPTKIGFETAFSFNILRDTHNNITSMQTADINVNYPLDLKYRNTATVTGNRLDAMIQTADNSSSDPFADYKKETIYKNKLGQDSLLIVERMHTGGFEEVRRIKVNYNSNGTIASLHELLPMSNNYELAGYRNFGYSGTKRITDTSYAVASGGDDVTAYSRLFYTTGDKLDSVMVFNVSQGNENLEAGYRMVYNATDGIAEIFVTRVNGQQAAFEFRIQYTGTKTTITPPVGQNVIEKLDAHNFVCYPVPAINQLTVSSTDGKKYSYVLVDIFGKQITSTQALTQTTFNTAALANGVYLLNMYNEAGSFTTKKIIVNH